MTKQIGWYNLKEDKVFTNYTQWAAWFEDVEVKAGRYPVVVVDYRINESDIDIFNGSVDGHISSVYVKMDGVIVGGYDGNTVGKESVHNMQCYMYNVCDSIMDDPETPCELLPEYEVREGTFFNHFTNADSTVRKIHLK